MVPTSWTHRIVLLLVIFTGVTEGFLEGSMPILQYLQSLEVHQPVCWHRRRRPCLPNLILLPFHSCGPSGWSGHVSPYLKVLLHFDIVLVPMIPTSWTHRIVLLLVIVIGTWAFFNLHHLQSPPRKDIPMTEVCLHRRRPFRFSLFWSLGLDSSCVLGNSTPAFLALRFAIALKNAAECLQALQSPPRKDIPMTEVCLHRRRPFRFSLFWSRELSWTWFLGKFINPPFFCSSANLSISAFVLQASQVPPRKDIPMTEVCSHRRRPSRFRLFRIFCPMVPHWMKPWTSWPSGM